jgi:hypothetical protein
LKQLIEDDVVEGRGFLVVRGIDPDSYTRSQQVIAYAGISSYVGKRGLQGKHVLGTEIQKKKYLKKDVFFICIIFFFFKKKIRSSYY